jgi:ribosomal protein L2
MGIPQLTWLVIIKKVFSYSRSNRERPIIYSERVQFGVSIKSLLFEFKKSQGKRGRKTVIARDNEGHQRNKAFLIN